MVALIRAVRFVGQRRHSGPFAANSAGQLYVLGHDGDPLGVDGAKVGVLKETHQVSLAGLLQRHDGGTLESQLSLEVLCNFADKPLEGQLSDQQFGALLVATDLTQSNSSRPVPMGFLDAASSRRALAGRLGSQLLPGGFSTGTLSCRLLSASHDDTRLGDAVFGRRRKRVMQIVTTDGLLSPATASRSLRPTKDCAPIGQSEEQRGARLHTGIRRRHQVDWNSEGKMPNDFFPRNGIGGLLTTV